MTVENAVGHVERDPEWNAARGELLELWSNAGRVADGQDPDDEDRSSFATLAQIIDAQHQIWQQHYVQALIEAMQKLGQEGATIEDLAAAFREIDTTDVSQMSHLADVAKTATFISDVLGLQ